MALEHLFDAKLQHEPGMAPLTDEGEGALVGSGNGTVTGRALTGALRWTLFEQPGALVCAMRCCPVLNFFASIANAQRWLAGNPDVRGTVISIEDAIAAGRTAFGDVLREE